MEFNRIIKLLRKERGITQKQAAEDLGVSQALLSHYEKGIRECGLDFVVRVADYYNVSCDYLLGRSAERNGMMLSAEDLPNPEKMKDNVYHGSVLPTMNKKLISNSLNVLYAKIAECHSKALTTEVSTYLMMAVANVAGSWMGSRLALRHGAGFVRWAFIIVVALLIAKTGHDAFVAR